MRRHFLFWLTLFCCLNGNGVGADNSPVASTAISWQPWSDSIFVQAKREHKFVLLDLQAVWCHWCHVMDVQTYANPNVVALIRAHYIAVRVDQDARPDLAGRYQDYGWPATVVFNADGGEIVKRQGYLPPRQMSSMLQAIIDDPTPGPSVTSASSPAFSASGSGLAAVVLRKQLDAGYDTKLGGWGTVQKFLNWDNVEYTMTAAQSGDSAAEKMARQTLDAQLKLVDPVWGGVDQYSAEGDWDHPHFEKIMQMQAENMQIYAEAWRQWKDPVYLKTAEGIHGYVRAFLTSPDGVVYTSQDADLIPGEHADDYFNLDDASRRKLGVPRIDRHIYARENGWFIEALCALYAATNDARYRDEASRAADWIVTHRSLPSGGFQHGEDRDAPLSLGDNLAMARSCLSLYEVTADQRWLVRAEKAAAFIREHFAFHAQGQPVGFATAAGEPAAALFQPQPDFDENVSLARYANLLFQYTSNPLDRKMAVDALRFASSTDIAQSRRSAVGGLLSAMDELSRAPLHLAIVGRRTDQNAQKLFATSLAFPVIYKQIEWIDPRAPSSSGITYPDLPQAAAYLCTGQACSSPVFASGKLEILLQVKAFKRPLGNP